MSNHSIVFSPTGGTRKCADAVANGFGGFETIDLTSRLVDFDLLEFSPEDLVLISVPSFRGRCPELALERLALIEGNGAKAAVNCTYGNRAYEDTLLELSDAAEKAGFVVVAAIASIAEHSELREFAAGRPDKYDVDKLTFFGRMVKGKVQSGAFSKPEIPGNRPYKEVTYTVVPPLTNETCVKCGKCAKRCPAGAISKVDPREVDKDKCILCMRCVSICPEKAKHLEPFGLDKLRERIGVVCSIRKSAELHI